jgi:hypothetical protein
LMKPIQRIVIGAEILRKPRHPRTACLNMRQSVSPSYSRQKVLNSPAKFGFRHGQGIDRPLCLRRSAFHYRKRRQLKQKSKFLRARKGHVRAKRNAFGRKTILDGPFPTVFFRTRSATGSFSPNMMWMLRDVTVLP